MKQKLVLLALQQRLPQQDLHYVIACGFFVHAPGWPIIHAVNGVRNSVWRKHDGNAAYPLLWQTIELF